MRKFLFISILLIVFNATLVVLGLIIAHALPSSPLMAFSSEADNAQARGYIYLVDMQRRLPAQITDSSYLFIDPVWSDDGQLALTRLDPNSDRWDVEVLNGIERYQITTSPSQYRDFEWSSDNVLAFDELGFAQSKGILLWNGEALTQFDAPFDTIRDPRWLPNGELAFNFSQPRYSGVAVWDGGDFQSVSLPELSNSVLPPVVSPDGWLAFLSLPLLVDNSGWDIFVWNGEETRNITNQPDDYRELAWSYDGRLAFVADDGPNNSEIYVWDGQHVQKISQNPLAEKSPRWSADGRLAFLSWSGRHWEILVWDGATLTNISPYPADHDKLAWSANGWLGFLSDRDGDLDVYVWDGSSTFQVSDTPGTDGQPQWWP
jgi:Tol biopolymer transport system component